MPGNKALVVTNKKEAEVREINIPSYGDNEVLLEMQYAAICTMEQRIFIGEKDVGGFPVIGGHEGVAIVKEIGKNVKHFKVGDHVVITDPYCGHCYYCHNGKESQCASGVDDCFYKLEDGTIIMDGFFQQYLNVNEKRLIKIPDYVSLQEACLAEPLACCLHSIKKGNIQMGDTVVVIGAGIMGLLHAQLAKKLGAVVIVSEVDSTRRKKALDLGIDYAFNPLEEDPEQYVKDHTDGLGAEVVYNTTAVSASWLQGISMLAPYGKIIAYSSQHPDNPIPIKMGMVHSKEIEIIGTVSPNEADFYHAARLISRGIIDMKAVIDHIIPIEEAQDAYTKAITPGTYRVLLKMQ